MGLDLIWSLNLNELNKVVNQFGLHSSCPANPIPVYESLSTIMAKKTLTNGRKAFSGRLPEYLEPFAIFDSSLSNRELYHPLWHELSHLLFDRPGKIYCLCNNPKYLRLTIEKTCELRAAYLSVPYKEMMLMYESGWVDTQVAGALKVPVHYLKMRHDIFLKKEAQLRFEI